MQTHAKGTFETKAWSEQPYSEVEGAPKITQGSMTDSFTGDIKGEATIGALMAYTSDSSINFVGLERVVGHIGSRSGSFILQLSGKFDMAAAKGACNWSVVPGSATGELRGLRGEGGYIWSGEKQVPYTLDYDFE